MKIKIAIFFIFSICLSTITSGQSTTVKSIYFELNSFKIEKRYSQQLDEIGRKFTTDTMTYMKIYAYSDTSGTVKHNSSLSEKRSLAVYNYLIKKFPLDSTRIYRTWLGEEIDVAYDLHFPAAHFQQRCVDVIVSFKKP